MTAIDDRAEQLKDQLGEALGPERPLMVGCDIMIRPYYNAWLIDIPGAGVYTVAEASVGNLFLPSAKPPAPATGLVEGIDVASYQDTDLSYLIDTLEPRPQHVIVRLYQEIESPPQSHSVEQIESARDCGCTVGAYVWLYASTDGAASVNSALDLADRCGLVVPVLWLDCETYTDGSYPSTSNIQRAANACIGRGVTPGIYTGEWFWRDYLSDTQMFAHLPLWHAAYGAKPTELTPVDYGGWGAPSVWQWTSDPVDRNVVSAAVTMP
jgi:GH25 family lysozyme M1 (1,4-beta-N-acetylmuramidase)